MEIYKMYEVINKKDKSFIDFIEFVDFMFENKDYINELPKGDQNNFMYHFNEMPIYIRNMVIKLRYELISNIANIAGCTKQLADKVDELVKTP